MKRILLLLLTLAIGVKSFGQGGYGPDGALHPFGHYPIVIAPEIKGAIYSVADITALNAIPHNFLSTYQLIWVDSTASFYEWDGSTTWWPITVGGGVWGAITGSLSSQTDLQSAFNAKQDLLGFTPENTANKATSFSVLNNFLFPTTLAVSNYVSSAVTAIPSIYTNDGTIGGPGVRTVTLGVANDLIFKIPGGRTIQFDGTSLTGGVGEFWQAASTGSFLYHNNGSFSNQSGIVISPNTNGKSGTYVDMHTRYAGSQYQMICSRNTSFGINKGWLIRDDIDLIGAIYNANYTTNQRLQRLSIPSVNTVIALADSIKSTISSGIANQTTLQPSSNFNISGTGTAGTFNANSGFTVGSSSFSDGNLFESGGTGTGSLNGNLLGLSDTFSNGLLIQQADGGLSGSGDGGYEIDGLERIVPFGSDPVIVQGNLGMQTSNYTGTSNNHIKLYQNPLTGVIQSGNAYGLTSTITSSTPFVLNSNSIEVEVFTGSTNQIVILPVVTGLGIAWPFTFVNNSTGTLTIESSGGNIILVMAANTVMHIVSAAVSGTGVAAWQVMYYTGSSGTAPTGANPTATAGTTAVNGSSTSFMRADAAPKVDSAAFQTVLNFFPKGDTRYAKTTALPVAANPSATAGTTTVNGSSTNFMRADAAPKVDSAAFQTVLNFFPKGDTRYAKTTALPVAANPTASAGLTAINGISPNFMRADAAPVIDLTISPTWTGPHIFNKSSLGTTPSDEISIATTTPAAVGAQQISPGLNFGGFGWATTSGTSKSVNARMYLQPVQGAATPSSTLNLDFASGAGAFANKFTFSDNGTFNSNSITSTGIIVTNGTLSSVRSGIGVTTTDAFDGFNNTAATVGIPVQISPAIRQKGSVWNTTTTAASNQFDWLTEARGVSGLVPTTTYYWRSSLVTGTTPSYTDRMSLDNSGNLNLLTGNLTLSTPGQRLFIAEGANSPVGAATLVAGTKSITINGLTSSSRAMLQFVSVGGTVTTTWQYSAVCTANTLTITAITNANTTDTSDTSTLNYQVIN